MTFQKSMILLQNMYCKFDTHPLLPAGGREDRRKEGETRMTYEEAFEFLDRTARGIAQMFGSSCETLVHDMSVPDHPILSIYNGHVSGREVGSTMDIMGVGQDLDEEARKTDFVNLYATTPAGQQIKSSTFHMMSDEYNLALGINFDYSSLVFANRILVDLMRAEEDLKSAIWRNGENRLGEILDECLAIVGKPVGALNKADRIKVIEFGITIAEGKPDEIKNDPKVIEAYLGKEEEIC